MGLSVESVDVFGRLGGGVESWVMGFCGGDLEGWGVRGMRSVVVGRDGAMGG